MFGIKKAARAKVEATVDQLTKLRDHAIAVHLAAYIEQLERLKWRVTRLDGKLNHALLGAPRRDDVTAQEVSHSLLAARLRLGGDAGPERGADATLELAASRLGALAGWPAPGALRRVLVLGARRAELGALEARWPGARMSVVDAEAERSEEVDGVEVIATDPVTALMGRRGAAFDAVVALDVYQALSPWERRAFFSIAWDTVGPGGALYAETPNTACPEVLFDTYWRSPRHLVPLSPSAIREAIEGLPDAAERLTGCWEGATCQPWTDAGRARSGGTRLFAMARRR